MIRLSPVTAAVLLVSVLFVVLLLSSHQSLLSLTQRYTPKQSSRSSGSGSECDLIYEVESDRGTGTGTGTAPPLIIRVPRQNIKITQAQAQALIENRNIINTLPVPITTQTQTQTQIQKQPPAPVKPLADGCHSVYLDLGTNIGVQIRKLYEPQLFPIAIIRHRFVDYFGTGDRKHVCSFGWEPNPRHVPWLSHQEYIYRSLGYRTHVFTTSGVFDKEDMAEFVTDKSYDNNEWAGKTKTKTDSAGTPTTTTTTGTTNNNAEQDKFTVHLFDFGQWYKTHILPRSIPDSEVVAYGPPRVLLKLDIEGPDWKIVAQLVRMGLWCTLDFVYQEHLTIPQREVLDAMQKEFGTACPTKTTLMDDETYHRARFPFPLVPAGAAAAGATWLDRFPLPKPWDLSVQGPLPTHKPYDENNKP